MTCDKILRKKINRSVIDLLFKAFLKQDTGVEPA